MDSDTYQGVLHVIFKKPWCDVSGICHKIADRCKRFTAAQHNADEQIKTTHVHCALEDFDSDNKIPVEGVRTFIPDEFKGKGQYAILKKTEKSPRKFYDYETLVIYIIKASVLNVKLVKHMSPEYLDELASKWVDHSDNKNKVPKNEECSKTHWEICQEVLSEVEKLPKDRINPVTMSLVGTYSYETIYSVLMKVLRKYRVRTSRNELERFLVTIMRDDINFQEEIMGAIKKNIFRS